MVCPCKFPLVFVDTRNGKDIEYIAIPGEDFENMDEVSKPEFHQMIEDGPDGESHKYMAVLWKDPHNAVTKKYDVDNHIVIAGCNAKYANEGLQCKRKELYVVLHPIDEWKEHHRIAIK